MKHAQIPEHFVGQRPTTDGGKEFLFENLEDIENTSITEIGFEETQRCSLVDSKGFKALEKSRYANPPVV